MQSVLRMAIVDPATESREHLKRLLADLDPVWVEAECPRYDQFPEILEQTNPDISVIGIDADPALGLELVAETARLRPNGRIIVVSRETDSQRILQAMRCGANEYLTSPVEMNDLLPALDRIRQSRTQETGGPTPSGKSKVIAVTGVVGGVGSTSIAVNLAASLASDPQHRVVLLDLDMVLGDADVCLDIVHNHTLLDVVENINRLDFTLLKRSLVQHSCGLFFLPHPNNLTEVERVLPENLKRLIGLLKATFTHVILDLSNGFRETDVAGMQEADAILLVSQLSISSVRNVTRVLKAIEGAPELLERMRIVLNRVGTKDQTISVEKAEEIIDTQVFWKVPNDWANVNDSRNNGVPLLIHAPKSRVSSSINDLALELDGQREEQAKNKKAHKRWTLFSLSR